MFSENHSQTYLYFTENRKNCKRISTLGAYNPVIHYEITTFRRVKSEPAPQIRSGYLFLARCPPQSSRQAFRSAPGSTLAPGCCFVGGNQGQNRYRQH